jgi:hypothetical protein
MNHMTNLSLALLNFTEYFLLNFMSFLDF